jgi:ATP-dependent RNA helicase DeaD
LQPTTFKFAPRLPKSPSTPPFTAPSRDRSTVQDGTIVQGNRSPRRRPEQLADRRAQQPADRQGSERQRQERQHPGQPRPDGRRPEADRSRGEQPRRERPGTARQPDRRPAPSQAHTFTQPARRPAPAPSSGLAALAQPPAEVRFREAADFAELASFAELKLRPETRAAVDAMGISVPTPIQAQAIPVMLHGDDVVGQAQTGSGKTLAFALPIVERIDPASRGVQALILVPTRELAIQVGSVIEQLARARRLKLTLLYGGRSLIPEARALAGGAQIVVGTPGRTLDHLRQGNLNLDQLKMFVLDEGDEMLDRGFAPDVERILSRTPATRQTALFSATVPPWVMQTAARHLRAPVLVKVNQIEKPAEIEHIVYDVDPNTRSQALRTLLDRRGDGPIIVFGRTKHGVKKLARQLEGEGFPVVALHGNLSQKARERAMLELRSGALPILVATNVAARGIDIADVGQVINYEVPESAELFTHRVGRTGRMGRSGEAITFVTPEESPKWRQIERALGRSLPRQLWDDGNGPVPVAPSAAPAAAPARQPAPDRRMSSTTTAPATSQTAASDAPRRRSRWRRPSGPAGQHPAR